MMPDSLRSPQQYDNLLLSINSKSNDSLECKLHKQHDKTAHIEETRSIEHDKSETSLTIGESVPFDGMDDFNQHENKPKALLENPYRAADITSRLALDSKRRIPCNKNYQFQEKKRKTMKEEELSSMMIGLKKGNSHRDYLQSSENQISYGLLDNDCKREGLSFASSYNFNSIRNQSSCFHHLDDGSKENGMSLLNGIGTAEIPSERLDRESWTPLLCLPAFNMEIQQPKGNGEVGCKRREFELSLKACSESPSRDEGQALQNGSVVSEVKQHLTILLSPNLDNASGETINFSARHCSFPVKVSDEATESYLQMARAEQTAENMRHQLDWWRNRSCNTIFSPRSVGEIDTVIYSDRDQEWGAGTTVNSNLDRNLTASVCRQSPLRTEGEALQIGSAVSEEKLYSTFLPSPHLDNASGEISNFSAWYCSYPVKVSDEAIESSLQVALAEQTAENMRHQLDWWHNKSFNTSFSSRPVDEIDTVIYSDRDQDSESGITVNLNLDRSSTATNENHVETSDKKCENTKSSCEISSKSLVKPYTTENADTNPIIESYLQVQFAEKTASEMKLLVDWWHEKSLKNEVSSNVKKMTEENSLQETMKNRLVHAYDDTASQSHCFPTNTLIIKAESIKTSNNTEVKHFLSYDNIDSFFLGCDTRSITSPYEDLSNTMFLRKEKASTTIHKSSNFSSGIDRIINLSDSDDIPSMRASDVSGTRIFDRSGSLFTLENSYTLRNVISDPFPTVDVHDKSHCTMVDDYDQNWKSNTSTGALNSNCRVQYSNIDCTSISVEERHAFAKQEMEKVRAVCAQTLSWADEMIQTVSDYRRVDESKKKASSISFPNTSCSNHLLHLENLRYFDRIIVKIYLIVSIIEHHLSMFVINHLLPMELISFWLMIMHRTEYRTREKILRVIQMAIFVILILALCFLHTIINNRLDIPPSSETESLNYYHLSYNVLKESSNLLRYDCIEIHHSRINLDFLEASVFRSFCFG